jgi:polysaccharide biosynthesis/export protein
MKNLFSKKRIYPLFLSGLVCLLALPLGAQSKSAAEAQPSVKLSDRPSSAAAELPIGQGDLVDISLFGAQDFREEVRVSNTGDISLPLIGLLHVAGLSPTEAESFIAKKLVDGNFYKNPQVSVLVKEYATEGIYVLGEVQKPGLYPALQARTLLQAISMAGGTTPKAGRKVTITNPGHPDRQLLVNLASTSDVSQRNPAVLPGDTVMVGKAGVVYVVGDVHLPSGIIMESENLTVLQAIALAQGTNPDAALDHAKLIRRGPDGPEETSLALKKMLALKTPDIKLEAEDIIFVPVSGARAFSHRGLEAIVQAATGVAMYSHY